MIDTDILAIFRNVYFWAAFISWCVAQFTKMLCGLYRTRRMDFTYMVSTGGMPSAHSALVSGLMTAVGLLQGFSSALFVIAMGMAFITMFDAATVRRAAGVQASLLNDIVDELFHAHHFSQRKLKELLGHTRLEVFMGFIVGIETSTIVVCMARTF
jgi:acid phosphatase family membrane protein YuiD